MKKRIVSLLLVLVMVFGLLPVTVQAEELGNGLRYKVYEDHVEITKYTGSATEVVIPNEIEGLPVIVIGDYAFEWRSNLTSVKLPDSVTSIGEGAFNACSSLISINIPDGVTSINSSTFHWCRKLSSINIPDNVTSIGERAFNGCSSLTSIDIPSGVTDIGNAAFSECSNLIEIHVNENNPNYSCDDRGVLFNKEKTQLISAPGAIADSYTIPYGVTSINDDAFSGCSNLTRIDTPDSVTSIGEGAFNACSNLTDIEISDSITTIHSYTFSRCDNLTTIIIPESVTFIDVNAFYESNNLCRIYFNGDAPEFHQYAFMCEQAAGVTAVAYYPSGNPTWTEDVMQNYGGTITWVPYNPNNPFTDVPVGSFYEAPVLWALEKNITTGATADTFNPNGQCLRAQVVTFLHRAAESPEPTSTSNPFADVKASDFFYKPVLWAVEQGITNGVSATKFGSYDVCNRAAVVTFLWRAAGSPEPESTVNPFTDVKPTDFYYKPVLWAVENGITNGISETEFGPTSPCNRAQVVTFLYRAYN